MPRLDASEVGANNVGVSTCKRDPNNVITSCVDTIKMPTTVLLATILWE